MFAALLSASAAGQSITAETVAGKNLPQAGAAGMLRIIVFGAHPDDAEFKAGGTAALWAKQGHQVKLVSVTNGDIGHWQMAGGPLAQRRAAVAGASLGAQLGGLSRCSDSGRGTGPLQPGQCLCCICAGHLCGAHQFRQQRVTQALPPVGSAAGSARSGGVG